MITKLVAFNFRNYDEINFKFINPIVLFYGRKTSGKTSILELIYYLSLQESFRTQNYASLIKENQNHSYISVNYNDKIISANLKREIRQHLFNNKYTIKEELINFSYPLYLSRESLQNFIKDKKNRQDFFDLMITMDKKIYSALVSNFKKLIQTLYEAEKINNYHSVLKKSIIEKLQKIEMEIIDSRLTFFKNVNIFFEKNSKYYLDNQISLLYLSEFKNENKIKEGLNQSRPQTILEDDFIFKFEKKANINFDKNKIKFILIIYVISFLEYIKSEYNQEFPLLLDEILAENTKEDNAILIKFLEDKKINAFITEEKMENIDLKILKNLQLIEL